MNMTREQMLSKAMDELLDEYELLVKSDAGLSPSGPDGDPLTAQDGKGGLPPGESQGANPSGMGMDPVVAPVVPVAKAPSPKGDAMGQDPVAPLGKAEGDDKEKPSTPPGFKGQDDDKSEGAEDEEDDSEADESDAEGEGDESDEGGYEEGDDAGADEGDDQDQSAGGMEGDDDGDPEFDAAVEKGIYKFMSKIGMTGEYAKSEVEQGESFAKSEAVETMAKTQETLKKAVDERFAKTESKIDEIMTLLKSVTESLGKISKAPISKPRAVSAVQPLRKSGDEVEGTSFTKSQISDKALALVKSGKVTDRNLLAKLDMAPNAEVAAVIARQAGVEV